MLAGHEAPVSSISFSPVDLVLATTSWDKTVRFWNVYESKSTRETITLIRDGKNFETLTTIHFIRFCDCFM